MSSLFNHEKIGNVDVIRLHFEEIGFEERDDLNDSISEIVQQGEGKYVLNLSKIGFMSSLVISLIVSISKDITANNGTLKLCCLSHEAESVFHITNIDQLLEIESSEEEALKKLSEQ